MAFDRLAGDDASQVSETDVADEVAGDDARSEQVVQCTSIRRIEEDGASRGSKERLPSVEEIKQQLEKIHRNACSRQQRQQQERRHQTLLGCPLQLPKHAVSSKTPDQQSTLAPRVTDLQANTPDATGKTSRKVIYRPREQPPPP